jgi:NADPH:quinone reductase-like Zn-dependent oxidoreductase
MFLRGMPGPLSVTVTMKRSAWAGVGEGCVRPRVDRAFPFERAAEAHAYLHERRNSGKVVLKP